MSTLRILQNGQINLPAEFRRDLGLKKGDIIDAEIQDGRIILTPVTLVEKKETEKHMEDKEKFFETVDELRKPTKDVPLRKTQVTIDKAVAAAKQAKKDKLKRFHELVDKRLDEDLEENECIVLA